MPVVAVVAAAAVAVGWHLWLKLRQQKPVMPATTPHEVQNSWIVSLKKWKDPLDKTYVHCGRRDKSSANKKGCLKRPISPTFALCGKERRLTRAACLVGRRGRGNRANPAER